MSAFVWGGLRDWSSDRDIEGRREYTARWLVKTTDPMDGPAVVSQASGLVLPGTAWSLGNDYDPWVFCENTLAIRRHGVVEGEKGNWWTVDQKFSSPKPNSKKCQDSNFDDPLNEPPKVTGSFVRFEGEVKRDRNNQLVLSSSFEFIRGLMRDYNRAAVTVKMNSAVLGLDVYTGYIDTLNDSPMWGLEARKIKFSELSWEELYYGTCYRYFAHTLTFEIRPDGFDRDDVQDVGYKQFDKDYTDNDTNRGDPLKYVVITDEKGNPIPVVTPLDGNGSPLDASLIHDPVYLPTIEIYGESNLLLLGIPSSLG